MRLDPLHLFFTGFLPPFFGAVSSIIVALILHNDEISNYNWQCGVSCALLTIMSDLTTSESSSTIPFTNNQPAYGENFLAIHISLPHSLTIG